MTSQPRQSLNFFWFIFGILTFAVPVVSYAVTPQLEFVEIRQIPMPNPVLTGATFTSRFYVHFRDPTTKAEIDPPAGTTYVWSCTSITGGTGMKASAMSFNPQDRLTTMSGSGTNAGTYTINVHVICSNPAWLDSNGNPQTVPGDKSVTETVSNVVASFSPSALKLDLYAPTGASEPLTVTISPASSASTVKFASQTIAGGAANGEATLSATSVANSPATLTLTAASPTDGGVPPGGDAQIVAIGPDGTILATLPYVVLEPNNVVESPLSTNTTVTNRTFNQGDTIPGDWNIVPAKSGQKLLATQAKTNITITLRDQFNQPLDANYNGTNVVLETISGNGTVNDQPILFPSPATLTNGSIQDECVTTRDVPADVTADPNNNWPYFYFSVYDANDTPYDNAIAAQIPTSPTYVILHQTISYKGDAKGDELALNTAWTRTYTLKKVNNTVTPTGIVMHVDEKIGN